MGRLACGQRHGLGRRVDHITVGGGNLFDFIDTGQQVADISDAVVTGLHRPGFAEHGGPQAAEQILLRLGDFQRDVGHGQACGAVGLEDADRCQLLVLVGHHMIEYQRFRGVIAHRKVHGAAQRNVPLGHGGLSDRVFAPLQAAQRGGLAVGQRDILAVAAGAGDLQREHGRVIVGSAVHGLGQFQAAQLAVGRHDAVVQRGPCRRADGYLYALGHIGCIHRRAADPIVEPVAGGRVLGDRVSAPGQAGELIDQAAGAPGDALGPVLVGAVAIAHHGEAERVAGLRRAQYALDDREPANVVGGVGSFQCIFQLGAAAGADGHGHGTAADRRAIQRPAGQAIAGRGVFGDRVGAPGQAGQLDGRCACRGGLARGIVGFKAGDGVIGVLLAGHGEGEGVAGVALRALAKSGLGDRQLAHIAGIVGGLQHILQLGAASGADLHAYTLGHVGGVHRCATGPAGQLISVLGVFGDRVGAPGQILQHDGRADLGGSAAGIVGLGGCRVLVAGHGEGEGIVGVAQRTGREGLFDGQLAHVVGVVVGGQLEAQAGAVAGADLHLDALGGISDVHRCAAVPAGQAVAGFGSFGDGIGAPGQVG